MPEARIVTLRGWKGHRSLRGVYSQSDVLRFERFDAQLFRVAGIVWPPAPIVQKLIKSNHTPHEHDSLLTHQLGYYCDLQSINSEDALTWNYFGPLLYAQPHERVQFAWWLMHLLDPEAEPDEVCEIDLWRRIPHPQKPGSTNGSELDFLLIGNRTVVLGEAKWKSDEPQHQGEGQDMSQTQLRALFVEQFGNKVFGETRRLLVLMVTLDPSSPIEGQECYSNQQQHTRHNLPPGR